MIFHKKIFFCKFCRFFPVKSDFTNFLYINAIFFDGFVFTFFAAQDDDDNKADQEIIADEDNADSASRQGRQFVGFCNPQDHVEMDMPSSNIHNNSNNR